MPYQVRLPEVLRSWGLSVEEVPGWLTRGNPSFNPRGAVSHWTAGPKKGDRPSLRICTEGRAGLPGPLCNVFLARSGVAIVVAAGRANHAGPGGWRGLKGNSAVFGTEAESSGDGDWTDAQRWSYPRINAAFCTLGGFSAEFLCGHSEWATPPGRKIDIRDWPMSKMREQVANLLATGDGDDDMPLSTEDIERVARAVWERQIRTPARTTSAEVILSDLDRPVLMSAVINGLLDAPLDRQDLGRGPTSLRQVLRWSDNHIDRLLQGVTAAAVASATNPAQVEAAVREAVAKAVAANYDATLVPKKD